MIERRARFAALALIGVGAVFAIWASTLCWNARQDALNEARLAWHARAAGDMGRDRLLQMMAICQSGDIEGVNSIEVDCEQWAVAKVRELWQIDMATDLESLHRAQSKAVAEVDDMLPAAILWTAVRVQDGLTQLASTTLIQETQSRRISPSPGQFAPWL